MWVAPRTRYRWRTPRQPSRLIYDDTWVRTSFTTLDAADWWAGCPSHRHAADWSAACPSHRHAADWSAACPSRWHGADWWAGCPSHWRAADWWAGCPSTRKQDWRRRSRRSKRLDLLSWQLLQM